MTIDKTWFDESLKASLYLDVGLRSLIWLVIAFLTISYASVEIGFSPISPLQRGLNTLMPVAMNVARVAMILCFLAVLLKDLEFVSPNIWGQDTVLGKIGGVVRRFAGDLSLWLIGTMVTLLASLIYFSVVIYTCHQWSPDVSRFTTMIGIVLIVGIGAFSVVNVWVRRKVSFVSSHPKLIAIFNSPWKVIGFYVALLTVTGLSK